MVSAMLQAVLHTGDGVMSMVILQNFHVNASGDSVML